jgi:hypothetical protein
MAGYFFNDEYATPDAIDRRRALINALAKDNLSTAPVGHWTAALARVVGAGADQYETAKLNEADKKGSEKWTEQVVSALKSQLGGGGISPTAEPSAGAGAPASPPAPAAPAPIAQQPLLPNRPQMPEGPNIFERVGGMIPEAMGQEPAKPSPYGQLSQAIAPAGGGPTPLMMQNGITRNVGRIGMMPVDTSLGYSEPGPRVAMAALGGGSQMAGGGDATFRRMLTQESGNRQFNRDGSPVTSPKGATGIAQVMPATGPEAARLAGLPWDQVRFRNDAKYNEALGRAYFDAQNRTFNDPIAAAAAYNAGPGRVNQAIAQQERTGQPYTDFLPRETQNYITKVGGPDLPAPGAQVAEQLMQRPAPGQFVNPMQGGGQGLNPQAAALLAALSSPWAARNPVLSQVGQSVLSQQLAGNKLQYQTDGEGNIIALDPTGRRAPQVVYKAAVKPIPLGEGQRLVNPSTGQVLAGNEDSKITRDIATREAEIRRRGLDPNDPTSQRYILTGQLPDPEIKADERKMIAEAEDQKTELSGTIESLRRARELAPQAYSGFGAGIRGTLGANLPGPGVIFDENRAKATTELGKLVSMEAISAMSASLKGATTDTELKQFTNILADANASPELKIRTIDRMLRLAETKSATADERIKGIRSKTYFQPQRQQGAQPAPQGQGKQPETPTFEETKEIGGKKYGRRGNDWFEVR